MIWTQKRQKTYQCHLPRINSYLKKLSFSCLNISQMQVDIELIGNFFFSYKHWFSFISREEFFLLSVVLKKYRWMYSILANDPEAGRFFMTQQFIQAEWDLSCQEQGAEPASSALGKPASRSQRQCRHRLLRPRSSLMFPNNLYRNQADTISFFFPFFLLCCA